VGRVMALDVGTKTIGVAVTDPLRMVAHPVTTVARKGVRKDAELLGLMIARKEGVEVVVVGLPLELDGSEERPARLARQIGEAVREVTGLPVHYTDERYSSVEAERRLIAAGVSRARRKEVIDQAAAVVILESWLAEQAG
jgi:putative holliday junction resolvase